MLMRRLTNRLIRVTGYRQEYLCLEAQSLRDRFQWTVDGASIDPHDLLFLGYRPLVLGLTGNVTLGRGVLTLGRAGKVIASMHIEPFNSFQWQGVRLLTGSNSTQHFLPSWLDPLDRLRQRLNERRAGNVTRSLAEYDQLRIAYAHPREIHLAVVGSPGHCNIFPTDLHGPLGNGEYVISLRHANKVCAQVEERAVVLLCRMALDSYKDVYRLGARHQAGWDPAERITATGPAFHDHAVPAGTRSAMLLELRDHHDIGIHRLFRFVVKDKIPISEGPVLAHAHAGPLGWLKRRGLAPTVLMR